MKQNFHSCGVLLFLLFLFTFSQTSARFLATKQGEKVEKLNNIYSKDSVGEMESSDSSFDELMGVEECGNGDEECLKRRIVIEAHLDYIYTQHHKP
ncbi:hypothetical protein LguiA_012379 [Lonicera macranthoides]